MTHHEAFSIALIGVPFLFIWLGMALVMWQDSRRERRERKDWQTVLRRLDHEKEG